VLGASVVVIDRGQAVSVVAGSTDLHGDRAVVADTQFRLASVSKLYLAALTLELAERGEVSLDQPIADWQLSLPPQLEFAQNLTLRQLLSHTSGLGQTFTRDDDRGRVLTTREQLDRIPPPVCAPSSCWSYADGNYTLVQVVLEAATQRSLAELLRVELFEPLGLRRTILVGARDVDTPLPSQYAVVPDGSGQSVEPPGLFEQTLPRSDILIATAADAASFVDALFSGEVLDAASLTAMLDIGTMRDLPCPDGCKFDYGLGVFHFDIAGRELVGHDGSSGAIVVHDPSRDLTVAVLTNGGESEVGMFLESVLDAIDADPETNVGHSPVPSQRIPASWRIRLPTDPACGQCGAAVSVPW
jgi:D-alanyl-D-alanine carboxypeptidase